MIERSNLIPLPSSVMLLPEFNKEKPSYYVEHKYTLMACVYYRRAISHFVTIVKSVDDSESLYIADGTQNNGSFVKYEGECDGGELCFAKKFEVTDDSISDMF